MKRHKLLGALSLLASTVSDINGSLNMASNEQLLRLHERFQVRLIGILKFVFELLSIYEA